MRDDAQGVQQPPDAQPESLPRGDPAIYPILQMGRRSAARFSVLDAHHRIGLDEGERAAGVVQVNFPLSLAKTSSNSP